MHVRRARHPGDAGGPEAGPAALPGHRVLQSCCASAWRRSACSCASGTRWSPSRCREQRTEPIRLTLSGGETRRRWIRCWWPRAAPPTPRGSGWSRWASSWASAARWRWAPTYQTAVPHIYAVGDVIGFPALASTAMEQARVAVLHAFGAEPDRSRRCCPTASTPSPRSPWPGETEQSLIAKGIPYVVGRACFLTNPRGQIIGEDARAC